MNDMILDGEVHDLNEYYRYIGVKIDNEVSFENSSCIPDYLSDFSLKIATFIYENERELAIKCMSSTYNLMELLNCEVIFRPFIASGKCGELIVKFQKKLVSYRGREVELNPNGIMFKMMENSTLIHKFPIASR